MAEELLALYRINRDAALTSFSQFSNEDLVNICQTNIKFGELCGNSDFWEKLWRTRFVDKPPWEETDDIQVRKKTYFAYNFADNLMKSLGDKYELIVGSEIVKLPTRDLEVGLEVHDQNVCNVLRLQYKGWGLNRIVKLYQQDDIQYKYLYDTALNDDNIDLFIKCLINTIEIPHGIINRLQTENHSKLVYRALNTTYSGVQDKFAILNPDIILNILHDECPTDLINARLLVIKIPVPEKNIESAIDIATKRGCTEILESLAGYVRPSRMEQLDYAYQMLVAYHTDDTVKGPTYSLSRTMSEWITEITRQLVFINSEKYIDYLKNLVEENDPHLPYLLSLPTGTGNLFVPLLQAMIDNKDYQIEQNQGAIDTVISYIQDKEYFKLILLNAVRQNKLRLFMFNRMFRHVKRLEDSDYIEERKYYVRVYLRELEKVSKSEAITKKIKQML